MRSYETITAHVIEQLEKGAAPWRRTWAGGFQFPRSLNSLKQYRGVNVFLLACQGYASPWWLSFRQAQELGGHVRKGEKSTPIVYFGQWEKENGKTGEVDKIPLLKTHAVFNTAQIDGIGHLVPPGELFDRKLTPIEACQKIVANMPNPPAIQDGFDRAFYRPSTDVVGIPPIGRFESAEAYHSTLFHELGHSTGHATRLSRPGIVGQVNFGSETYGNEELVAEMTAAFLCGHAGIETATLENTASYVAGWLAAIKRDVRLVVTAAAQAQKAADYILAIAQ